MGKDSARHKPDHKRSANKFPKFTSIATQQQELRIAATLTKFEPWITRTPFFNTGTAQVDRTGKLFYTACNNQVFCVNASTGNFAIVVTLNEDEKVTQLTLQSTTLIVATQRLLRQYKIDSKKDTIMSILENGLEPEITLTLERTWRTMHNAPISCLVLSEFTSESVSDTRILLASGSSDSSIKVWDLASQYCTHNLKEGSNGVIRAVKFYPFFAETTTSLTVKNIPLRMISGADDCMLRVWHLTPSSCVASLKGHMSPIIDIITYNNVNDTRQSHNRAVTSSREKLLILWDLEKLQSLIMLPVYNQIESLAFCPYTLASDVIVNAVMFAVEAPASESSTGTVLNIQIWDVEHARCLKQLTPNSLHSSAINTPRKIASSTSAAERTISSIVLRRQITDDTSDEGKTVDRLFISTSDNCIQICRLPTLGDESQSHFVLEKQLAGTNDDEILGVALLGAARDVGLVLTNSARMYLYDLRTWACTFVDGHEQAPVAAATFGNYSPNNIFCTGSKDNKIKLWRLVRNAATENEQALDAELLATGTGHTHTVTDVACFCCPSKTVTANNTAGSKQPYIVSVSEDLTLKLWTTTTNNFFNDNDADGAKTGGSTVQLICMQTVAAHRKPINCVGVDRDAEYIITGSQDRTARVFSANQQNLLNVLGELRGHARGIWAVNILSRRASANGIALAATGSADSTIKLWSLNDFACLHTLQGHECSVLRVRILGGGQQLVSAGSDGLIKMWTIPGSSGAAGKATATVCTDTYDEHDDRVWGLDVAPFDDAAGEDSDKYYAAMLTGGADSRLCLWRNISEKIADEARDAYNSTVERRQHLSNVMHAKDFKLAFRLALELEQPFTLFQVMKELMASEITGSNDDLMQLVAETPHLERLLLYAAEWNTNSRHALIAQNVLRAIFATHTQAELLALPQFRSTVDGLLAYNERHLQRADALMVQSHFLSFLLSAVRQGFEDDIVVAMPKVGGLKKPAKPLEVCCLPDDVEMFDEMIV